MARLTNEELQYYRENGYLLYHKPLFSAEKLEKLNSILEDHLLEKGSKLSDELDTPHFRDERLLEYLLSDEALDLVEAITGPDIIMWTSHFISKDPYVGRATPWHEDSAYWKDRFDNFENIVTIWVALDRSNKENGCMRVIPGSHSNGFSDYEEVDVQRNLFNTQVKNIDDSKAVYFELEHGECSLHDSRIIHGAAPNTSPHRRCGYTMRYLPASTKVLDVKKNEGWKFWLARGKDVAGNHYVNS